MSITGYYAYIEASSPRRPGDNALLDFDSDLSSGSTCISFSYQMNGRDVGELRVLVNGNVEFSSKGSKGTKWIKKMMTIAGVAAKKVSIIALVFLDKTTTTKKKNNCAFRLICPSI